MRPRIVAGNWKMNATAEQASELVSGICAADLPSDVTVVVCPPTIWLERVSRAARGSSLRVGAQNVSEHAWGAYTGEVSAFQVRELCEWTILGHSERRHLFGESDELVGRKVERAAEAGLKVILAVGETEEQHDAGESEAVVTRQLRAALLSLTAVELAVAYEPVWAIGTGRPATPEYAQRMAVLIREQLDRLGLSADWTPVLYGGSVTPQTFPHVIAQPDVDGALVGGASLEVPSFSQIVAAAARNR